MDRNFLIAIAVLFIVAGLIIVLSEKHTREKDTNLRLRYLSAIVLACGCLVTVYTGGDIFAAFVFLSALICVREFLTMVDVWSYKPYRLTAIISVALVVLAAAAEPPMIPPLAPGPALEILHGLQGVHPFYAVIAPVIMINLLTPIVLRSYQGMVWKELATIFAVLYFGWFLAHSILIRNLEQGLELTTFLFLVVVANDIGAYVFGRLLGKHKLLSEISPRKTVEGFVGGIFCSLLTASAYNAAFPEFSPLQALLAGLVISLAAPFGDLIVSVIKRDLNQKDSSKLIPGHGGLLDRSDSIILSAPNFYYLVILLHSTG